MIKRVADAEAGEAGPRAGTHDSAPALYERFQGLKSA
jgi:hypothetical protein